MRIVRTLFFHRPHFTRSAYSASKAYFKAVQIATAAIRILAYGTAADSLEEYLRIGICFSFGAERFPITCVQVDTFYCIFSGIPGHIWLIRPRIMGWSWTFALVLYRWICNFRGEIWLFLFGQVHSTSWRCSEPLNMQSSRAESTSTVPHEQNWTEVLCIFAAWEAWFVLNFPFPAVAN